VRTSGEYQTWQALNLHSSAAFDKGTSVHVQALPSLAETMFQAYKSKKESLGAAGKQDVLQKYGNAGAALFVDAALLLLLPPPHCRAATLVALSSSPPSHAHTLPSSTHTTADLLLLCCLAV
jgi:Pre-mRNA splicing Prp18-interacting factor